MHMGAVPDYLHSRALWAHTPNVSTLSVFALGRFLYGTPLIFRAHVDIHLHTAQSWRPNIFHAKENS